MKRVFICALLTGGCTQLANPLYVDERFTADEVLQLQAAADAWGAATGSRVGFDLVFGQRVEISQEGRKVVFRATEQEANAAPWSDLHADDLRAPGFTAHHDDAWGHEDRKTIVLVPSRLLGTGVSLARVVMHEFGHATGLHHVEAEGSIMFPSAPRADEMVTARCLPQADFVALRGIGVDFDGATVRRCRPFLELPAQ